MAGGAAVWINDHFLLTNSNGVLAVVLAVVGLSRVVVAVRSRPFSAWVGTFLSGLLLVGTAWLAWKYRDGATAGWIMGAALSVSFISAGVSTIWLNLQLKNNQLA